MDEFYAVLRQCPRWLSLSLESLPEAIASQTHEIRLRTGAPITLTVAGTQMPASSYAHYGRTGTGFLPACKHEHLTAAQIEECLFVLCGGSVHSYEDELRQGFFTLAGGHRVGVGGKYFQNEGGKLCLQSPSSLNIRIARARQFSPPPALCSILETPFTGLLILGEPDSGKTTVLRALVWHLAKHNRPVAVIDEREELFLPPTQRTFDANSHTHACACDVLSGIDKGRAVQMALRTLSPSVIVLDELGALSELQALEQGFFGGVDFIATLHAHSFAEAARKPQFAYLRERNMLRAACLLKGRHAPGELAGIETYD